MKKLGVEELWERKKHEEGQGDQEIRREVVVDAGKQKELWWVGE